MIQSFQHTESTERWSFLHRAAFWFITVFILLFMLSFPLTSRFIPTPGEVLRPIFEPLVAWFAVTVLNFSPPFESPLLSDTTGLYVHLLVLAALSGLACIAWSLLDRKRLNYQKALYWLVVIASYYAAFQLFEYGFNKVFKWQFYLPEPNTLFTTVGETPRDLLYWSVMGASRPYTMFAGVMEVLAGLLLLFRRTRTVGALLALGVMVNVVAINFAFDISVKVYSSFLLLLSLTILAPDAKNLLQFFFGDRSQIKEKWGPLYSSKNRFSLYVSCKGIIVAFMLFDVLTPYVRANNFNDDNSPRPPLHGAWGVQTFIQNSDTIPPLTTLSHRWQRVFIHRKGYLIVQRMDDTMLDYELHLNTANKRMQLKDPRTGETTELSYGTNGPMLSYMKGLIGSDSISVVVEPIDLTNIPLFQNEFHWAIDSEFVLNFY